MQRYEEASYGDDIEHGMDLSHHGEWVRYEDALALEQRTVQAEATVSALEENEHHRQVEVAGLEQRAEQAEAERDKARQQIVALRKALAACVADPWDRDRRERGKMLIYDTAAAAEAHDAAVRRAALEEAAQAIRALPNQEQEDTSAYSEYNEALDVAEHAVRQLAEGDAE